MCWDYPLKIKKSMKKCMELLLLKGYFSYRISGTVVASQQEGPTSPSTQGLSVWSLNVLPVFEWFISRYPASSHIPKTVGGAVSGDRITVTLNWP